MPNISLKQTEIKFLLDCINSSTLFKSDSIVEKLEKVRAERKPRTDHVTEINNVGGCV